jgi:hypothetical protein
MGLEAGAGRVEGAVGAVACLLAAVPKQAAGLAPQGLLCFTVKVETGLFAGAATATELLSVMLLTWEDVKEPRLALRKNE